MRSKIRVIGERLEDPLFRVELEGKESYRIQMAVSEQTLITSPDVDVPGDDLSEAAQNRVINFALNAITKFNQIRGEKTTRAQVDEMRRVVLATEGIDIAVPFFVMQYVENLELTF